jgi:hypothetical protein
MKPKPIASRSGNAPHPAVLVNAAVQFACASCLREENSVIEVVLFALDCASPQSYPKTKPRKKHGREEAIKDA